MVLLLSIGCDSDDDTSSALSTAIIGKWRLVSVGYNDIPPEERQELTFTPFGNGSFSSNRYGEVEETISYYIGKGDKEHGDSRMIYLRVYSRLLGQPRLLGAKDDFIEYSLEFSGETMRLSPRGILPYVDISEEYVRVK